MHHFVPAQRIHLLQVIDQVQKGLSYRVKRTIIKVVAGFQDHIYVGLIKKLLNIHIHGIQNIIIKVRHARIRHIIL